MKLKLQQALILTGFMAFSAIAQDFFSDTKPAGNKSTRYILRGMDCDCPALFATRLFHGLFFSFDIPI